MKGYRLFRIFGFEVKLNLTWLLLALLITWTLAAGLFPASYPELNQSIYWWMGLSGAIGILFSIVFHELSHSLVARFYGLQIKGITLFIFGGVAEMQEEPVSPRVEFLMAVAGPVASVLLALVFFLLEQMATALGWSTAVIGVSHYLAMVNMIVAVFNLVPAFPLDGGRMLRAVLWHWQKNLQRATHIASQFGSGFGLALMILGGLAFIQGNFIAGMWWVLIGAFLRTAANGSYQQLLIQEMLSNKPVRQFMNTEPVTVSPDITIERWLEDYVYKYHYKMFPVIEDSRLLGCIVTDSLKKLPRDEWRNKTVGDLTTPCSHENTVSPDTDTANVLAEMMKPDSSSRFMVVKNNSLEGMISLKDLRSYIALKMEIESS
ncbi:MAG: site-2 protease family protein [Gammaproteobacteria bacterium]|nr:site-2 protease family protein [Gammaproteobacteria bacterium]